MHDEKYGICMMMMVCMVMMMMMICIQYGDGMYVCYVQEFDKCYGDGWQCVVGTNFGSFVTHTHGNFIYFCVDKLAFLLFKGTPACCVHH